MSVYAKTAESPSSSIDAAAFARDGFVVARGIVPLDLIAGIRARLADIVDRAIATWHDAGEIADPGAELPLDTRLHVVAGALAGRLGRSWRRDVICPALHRLHHAPTIVAAVSRLLGDEIDGHPIWNARPKLPGQQMTIVPWHQDSGYFGPSTVRSEILTVWIPLVPVDAENGTLQLARGSHRFGLMHHVTESRDGQFLEIAGGDPDPALVETPSLSPGDAILLHNLCWHRSLPNRSPGIRWSIDIRYLRTGDDPGGEGFPGGWTVRSAVRPPTEEASWLERAGGLPW
jgi:phytanoyl-CoA hydroxylase